MNLDTKSKKAQIHQSAASQVETATTDNAFQFADNRPTSITQLKIIEKINNSGTEVAQLSGKGNKKQQKQKAAAAAKKKKQQSQADRNAFRAIQYETTSKKQGKAKQDLARKVKGNIAHGTGDKSKGKQGKTKQELDKINKQLRAQRQAEVEKALKNLHDRSDRDDRGGAGGADGIVV